MPNLVYIILAFCCSVSPLVQVAQDIKFYRYGVDEGLISSFPVRSTGDGWEIVQGVELNEFGQGKLAASVDELRTERDLVSAML